ncbi:alpha/beta hydrolase [Cupriavidus basilensis]
MPRPRLLSLLPVLPLVGLGACSTSDVLNGLTQSRAYALTASVPYADGARGKLDIYAPREPACSGKAPVVVFFYGGTWNSGERADYAFVAAALAARGILTVIPDYRLYPEASYPDFLVDNARAVAWTRREIANYGGDPQRLFVMGHSAGGYNAAMLAPRCALARPRRPEPRPVARLDRAGRALRFPADRQSAGEAGVPITPTTRPAPSLSTTPTRVRRPPLSAWTKATAWSTRSATPRKWPSAWRATACLCSTAAMRGSPTPC